MKKELDKIMTEEPSEDESSKNQEKWVTVLNSLQLQLKTCIDRCQMVVPPSMPQAPPVTEPVGSAIVGEEELTGLLLATNGWDECQLEMLDSILDSL